MESKVTQGSGATTASSSGSKASMPGSAKKLSSSEISSAVSYNKKNNQSICKKIQTLVGATPDNAFGPKTVQAIANWQATKSLDSDGKFGPASKKAAGFTSSGGTTSAASTSTSSTSYPTSSGSRKKLTQSQINSAITFNKNNNQSICTKIQRLVGVAQDNVFGPNTVQAIADWQAANGLTADGKFGSKSAEKAGISIPAKTETPSVPSGSGINPKPSFDKQYNYKTSPYVSKAHYNEMKKAMGDVPYSKWNINNKKISGIYAKAKKANNGDNTTISSSGCGVTAYANLKKISPKTSAEMAMKGGYRVYNSGTAKGFFTSNGGSNASSASSALKSVANGKYAICSMNNANGNYWTKYGHFILVYGYDGTYVYVSDSASSADKRAKAKKKYFTDAFKYGFLF